MEWIRVCGHFVQIRQQGVLGCPLILLWKIKLLNTPSFLWAGLVNRGICEGDLQHMCHVCLLACGKCKLVALLEEKVQQLETCLSTLGATGQDEEFLDRAEWTVLQQWCGGGGGDAPREEIAHCKRWAPGGMWHTEGLSGVMLELQNWFYALTES